MCNGCIVLRECDISYSNWLMFKTEALVMKIKFVLTLFSSHFCNCFKKTYITVYATLFTVKKLRVT